MNDDMPTILIADDDRALVEALAVRFRSEGYHVVPAYDAYQAVQAARVEQPDLLLIDVNMPAGNGLSTLDRIERLDHAPDCRLIFLTGEHSKRVRIGAAAHGAFAVVYKPFETSVLVDTVFRALQSTRVVPHRTGLAAV
jgi:DNA-binding response OmpR family regulator